MTVPGSSVYLRWKYDSSGHAWHCTSPSRAAIATLRLVPGKPGTTLYIHTTSIPASYNPHQHGYDSDTSEASPNPHAAQNLFDALVLAANLKRAPATGPACPWLASTLSLRKNHWQIIYLSTFVFL
ncbi:hypothetical protein BN14_03783 [Rhizoctonia solani AG-1 IB]|nr:hypothetical protein BN14_03783 [Rhizoctonia solani AG-1 IB]